MSGGTATPRERYRTQVRTEIKELAWEQIGTAGASALSLNAIAKRMGMSGPALYRYFGSRDELMTELITDAYRSLADTFKAAADRSDPSAGPSAAPSALARALRRWALADPQRYFLIYGTPVPGYHAPDAVTSVPREIMATLLDAFAAVPPGPAVPFDDHLAEHRDWAEDHPAATAGLRRALTFWTRLHGVISLEIAGHFTGMGFDPERLYESELGALLAE